MIDRAGTTGRPRQRRRGVLAAVGIVGLAASSLIGMAGALLAARWTSHPHWFLGVGLAVTAGAAFPVAALTLSDRHTRVRVGVLGAALTAAATGTIWLLPLNDLPPPPPPTDLRYWQLPSGSRLGYLTVPAAGGPARRTPVVVLHGGPGIPDLTGDAAYWGQLSRLGFNVYVYAQLGAGPSTRLTDPTEYQVGRDVSDLEQVRLRLGADRLILIGHSYGGFLAAAYLADHPERVERLVLTSPGSLDPADRSAEQATARLTPRQRLQLYPSALQPRALLGYLLLRVNPAAAHAYLPDDEADARNDTILTRAASGLHCTAADWPRVSGSGFYRLQSSQSRLASPPDLRPRLVTNPTPTLILKGGCDYLSWTSATGYRRVLPRSSLIYLPDAGHNISQEAPDTVLAAAAAFIRERPSPVPLYQGLDNPVDYQHR